MVLRLTVDTDCDTGTGNVLLGNIDAGNRIWTIILTLAIGY